jgi:hypothetical protein
MQSVRHYQYTASNEWMIVDNKFETVSEETFFVKVNLTCGICVDGLRKAT